MEDNQKYNKRRRSYTEFRTSYSDNKDYFISTDRKSSKLPVLKYVIITVVVIVFIFAGFIITDALLNISEEKYEKPSTTETQTHTDIDKKYFENIVTTKPVPTVEETTTAAYHEDDYDDEDDDNYDGDDDYDNDYNSESDDSE